MINEYALDPALLDTWDAVRFYLDKFGIDAGRFLAQYPAAREWAAAVLKNFPSPAPAGTVIARHKVVERLEQVQRTGRLFAAGRGRIHWNPALPWLPNAEQEHLNRAFHAIVTLENPGKRPHLIIGDEINETDPPALWRFERSREVPRKGPEMAKELSPLFALARTVLFVDRNFAPLDAGYCKSLAAFLQRLYQFCRDRTGLRVEYHTGDDNPSPKNKHRAVEFVRICSANLAASIPSGMRVRFVRWRYKELHDRYVITDRAAVYFGQGLDEAGAKEDIQTVRLTLLDTAAADDLREQYIGAKPRYTPDPGSMVEVLGTRAC
jgi:hypothetical protein